MAEHSLKEIGRALQNQIFYAVAKDKDEKTDKSSFLTLCMPGLPYRPGDFDFASKGLMSKDPTENQQRSQAAFNFASLLDVVPSHEAVYDGVAVWKIKSASRLSTKYELALKNSRVAVEELSEEDKKKLDAARKKIFTVTKEGGEEVLEKTGKYKRYQKYGVAYDNAVMDYNRKRLRYQTCPKGEESQWQSDWQVNGQTYLRAVTTAWDEWTTFGSRGEIGEAIATIEQYTQRSAKQWKKELQSTYRANWLTLVGQAARYPFTTLTPANFAKDDSWTKYSLKRMQLEDKKVKEYEDWQVGASGGWGFWSASGGVKSSSKTYTHDYKLEQFEVEFEITQAQIVRPWFYPEFLESRGWKFNDAWTDGDLSDGNSPPKGFMVAYPLHVIFIRELKIKSSKLVTALKEEMKKVESGSSFGFGPFTIKGKYNAGREGSEFKAKFDEDTVTVPGMQIIAFRNHIFSGKTPNPTDKVKGWE
ncbi:hypothetical protein ACFQ7J_25855 [Streptomyces sp. NPDC056501]|uniref:hypothetical protein n=1 Tax=Streptomyces sp. NPDC056501 TaxID=3345841 RepID=UPI00369B2BD0